MREAAALACGVLAAWPAAACPDCWATRTAKQQVLQTDFASNAVVALAPFLVLGAIAWWADRIGRAPRDARTEDTCLRRRTVEP